ncbi:MAG: NADH-quinone oxidoreductase subunit C [Thermoplasmata archaeon]
MSFDEELVQRLRENFPDDVTEAHVVRSRRVKCDITREALRGVSLFLRDEMGFEHISCISGVDWIEHMENVYHIVSYQHGCVVQLGVRIPSGDLEVDTVSDIWKGALYHEREAYDLLGIRFNGHPDLRRILLPKDFKFHPLRKDYQGE